MVRDAKKRVDATPISVGTLSTVATFIVLVLWLILGFVAYLQDKPNEFGDMFGAASSLFSGLAFAGIIVTI
jgi:hypothetical protein